MTQEASAMLEKSLEENDRVRGRQLIAFGAMFLATVVSLLWLGYLAGKPSTDLRELVLWAVIAIFVSICYGMMALALYINRAVGRVLKTLRVVSGRGE